MLWGGRRKIIAAEPQLFSSSHLSIMRKNIISNVVRNLLLKKRISILNARSHINLKIQQSLFFSSTNDAIEYLNKFGFDFQIDNSRIMKIHIYYIYILSNKNDTVLYVGVTNDLTRRCHEHKRKLVIGFTKKYNVDKLVYYEVFDSIIMAINREKQIKGYGREKKDLLIDKVNPGRNELYHDGTIEKIS